MAQKRFRKVRYSSVLARRAGIDGGVQKYSLPKSARAFFPAIKPRGDARRVLTRVFFWGATVRIPFSEKSNRRCCCFGHIAGFATHTHARTRERRGVRAASPSRLSTNTNARPPASRRTRLTFAPTLEGGPKADGVSSSAWRTIVPSRRATSTFGVEPGLADAPDTAAKRTSTTDDESHETMSDRDFEADRARLAKARKKRLAVAVEALASDAAVTVVPKDEAAARLIMRAVRDNPLFEGLPDETRAVLVSSMTRVEVPAGHDIITQGDENAEHFYVLEGRR